MTAIDRPMTRLAATAPPHLWFVVAAAFHYLGPSFAVLLFAQVGVLGVAWFRIATAAAVFALWARPWRAWRAASRRTRGLIVVWGASIAAMNSLFYVAIDRLPLGLVATIEFVPVIAIALAGVRSARNLAALVLAALGVHFLTELRWSSDLLGLAAAAANALLFAVYIVVGHRIARDGAGEGVDRLAAAMAAGFVFVMPIGLAEAAAAFGDPLLVAAGIGVGICSTVIPYVCDQLAMSRLPRSTYALLISLLPASAAVVGALVLGQVPTGAEMLGIGLVMAGIAVHKPAAQ